VICIGHGPFGWVNGNQIYPAVLQVGDSGVIFEVGEGTLEVRDIPCTARYHRTRRRAESKMIYPQIPFLSLQSPSCATTTSTPCTSFINFPIVPIVPFAASVSTCTLLNPPHPSLYIATPFSPLKILTS
jgi:hypothetical protein